MRRAPAIARRLQPQARRTGDVDIELLDGAEIDDAVAIAVQRRELARGLNHRVECLAGQGAPEPHQQDLVVPVEEHFEGHYRTMSATRRNAGAGDCRSDRIL
jgi:hypothetical protein